jgi:hypothetical protein
VLSIGQRRVLNDAQISDFDPTCFGAAVGGGVRFRFGAVPPWSAIAICQPAVGGGGLRTEAAVLNNPAAGFMPTVGTAPRCGLPFTGREPHAIPGVTLPLAVILTANRLQSPRRPARQTALDLGGQSNEQKQHPLRPALIAEF